MLIVEHTPVVVQAIKRWIERLFNLQVVGTVSTVDEAIQLEQQTQPDVILYGLTQLHPPGIENLPRLRRALPAAYIIAISFEPNDESREPALAAGADEYVSGFKIDLDLIPAIQRGIRKP